jgi:anti-sigma B factor antagonist
MSASPERVATTVDLPGRLGRCEVVLSAPSVGQLAVLRVIGEVDSASISLVSVALGSCLARRPAHLIVDLTQLHFCSARGLALLVDTGLAASKLGIGYSLAGCSGLHERLLVLLWHDQAPRRYRDVPEALDEAAIDQEDDFPRHRAGTERA